MPKYKILKLRADKIINLGVAEKTKVNKHTVSYKIDLDQSAIYGAVVEEQLQMENCALFDQFQIVLKEDECQESIREWLLQEFVIVDFTHIYKKKTDIPENFIESLITDGFLMQYKDREVHMLPFDKSGNMSRKCRLSFINAEYLQIMNERLNLGIDFTQIALNLSKYYAYRGLYLSTAKRIQNELLKITPETLVVVDDQINMKFSHYQKNVDFIEGVLDEADKSKISFSAKSIEKVDITVPFDGQGIISPFYADLINETLEADNIHSFQIRLPFSKGMLHRVDFYDFLHKFDDDYDREDAYMITDAFGIKRDLKLANIIMTKSMFKGAAWLTEYCGVGSDPMNFYCDAIEKYQHALYVSSTDLPYGNSRVTHISYQLLNTLQLSEEQFQSLIDKQLDYIHNPIKYIEMTQGQCVGEEEEDDDVYYKFSNWQKAVLLNSSFANLVYIKNQLKNTQAALMTKLALGKLVVKGQMRYMTRDLPFMLVSLIQNENIRKKLVGLKIFSYKFYLPQGTQGENKMELDYDTYCGFFRSPHLSRNEQGLLAPVIKSDKWSEDYNKRCAMLDRYFGHLTGIVMFGNESLEPMALGGADFDGDLVSMIMDEDIVEAIKAGVYDKGDNGPLDVKRKSLIPYIKIPSIPAENVTVPETIPYLQIKNTFSNKIGLISNAAIAIGQYEYGNKKREKGEVTCSQCTILTGLEIDATKNGVHPDLSCLTNDKSLTTCAYLEFKKEFEKLKKNRNFHFNQLTVEKNGKEYKLGLEGSKEMITYIEEEGTFINKLPIIFMENLKPELYIGNPENRNYFVFPELSIDEKKEKVFQEKCRVILDSYRYYSKLQSFIQERTSKEDYSEVNLKKLLYRQYDSEYVDRIMMEDLPYIYEKMTSVMKDYSIYKKMEHDLNEMQWHLMNRNDKKQFLREVLGVEEFAESKWEIVLQPYNHSYKILWYIIQKIGSALTPEYSAIKNEFNENEKKSYELYPYVVKMADKLLKNSLENKVLGVSTRLYNLCLEILRDTVKDFNLPLPRKIDLLFKMTKSKSKEAQFFWECFEWEELETYIVKEKHYAE